MPSRALADEFSVNGSVTRAEATRSIANLSPGFNRARRSESFQAFMNCFRRTSRF